MSVVTVEPKVVTSPGAQTEFPHFVRRLFRRKLAVLCIAYLTLVVGIGVLAPFVLPAVSSERAGDLLATHEGPSWDHLLGTDTLGRDVLGRLLVGTRVTIIGVGEALVTVLVLGIPLGLAAGYFGGWIDRVVGRSADVALAMPGIIVVLVVVAVFPHSMLAAMVTYGVLVAPELMRIVRSTVLPVKEELYIDAARVSGLSHTYIVACHVFPRISGAVIVQASLLAAGALLVQSGLAFLGLVGASPAPSWGGMVADGLGVIVLQPWLLWPPGAAIALTVLALGLLGDAVRDLSAEAWAGSVHRPRSSNARRRNAVPTVTAGSDSLLSISGLHVGFRSDSGYMLRVVEDVSFDIRIGETLGVVGESGCGKTITAMSILGLLPGTGTIESGRILFAGRDLTTLSERELHRIRGKEIGLISQDPMASLDPAFRVGSQLAEVVRCHHNLPRRDVRRRVLDLLDDMQLPEPETVARRYPHELSGGMAQRITIARALAGEPRLLIADEPTTALDVTLQAEILELLRELQRERGMAVLLVTHDWGVVADICDRAVVMYAGQVVERADLLPMSRQPLHPYTEALLAASPNTASRTEVLQTIEGSVPQPGQWPSGCHFHPRCHYAVRACEIRPIPLERPLPQRETRCIRHEELLRGR